MALKAQPNCDKIHSRVKPIALICVIFVLVANIICIFEWERKHACCTKTKVKHVYLFLLCAEGHCFHGNSLMASFAFLFFVILSLQSLHICNISV